MNNEEIKVCSICNIEQSINNFSIRKYKEIISYRKDCKKCCFERSKKYVKNNQVKIFKQRKNYREKNNESIKLKKKDYYNKNKIELLMEYKQYYIENKEQKLLYQKQYRENHKDDIKITKNNYQKNKRKNDVYFRLRDSISYQIVKMLKNNNSSKKGHSCLTYLEYTIDILKMHIESLFESWMNWNNWGKYDPLTYDINPTWNLDHIKPHSTFKYNTMDCKEFRDCWALNNLRPYSSKQNLLDGVNRIRH